MKSRSGRVGMASRPYSLKLGLKIKQRLWETLNCPSLVEMEHSDGRVLITESFSTTAEASLLESTWTSMKSPCLRNPEERSPDTESSQCHMDRTVMIIKQPSC